MKTLVLYAAYTDQLSYYDDWVDAFRQHQYFTSDCVNVYNNKNLPHDLNTMIYEAEVIVLHHSMNADTLKYLTPFVSQLKSRKGKLVSFVGNEVNIPAVSMADKIKILDELDTDIIATQLLQDAGTWLYSDCKKAKIISLPHALNANAFYSSNTYEQRSIDVGTRSNRYAVYVGDNDRNNIIDFFYQNSVSNNLIVDLGKEPGAKQRFNRQEWCNFLSSCKSTLSTEAGSLYLDKDDAIVSKIITFAQQHGSKIVLPNQGIIFRLLKKILNRPLKNILRKVTSSIIVEHDNIGDELDYFQLQDLFFQESAKCPVYSKAISSRHFDAIGTKTLNIMYPGRYNDILHPEHYFTLNKDHSNLHELVELLNDKLLIKKITDDVYDYAMAEHTHSKRLDKLHDLLTD